MPEIAAALATSNARMKTAVSKSHPAAYYIETASESLNKQGEELCGDRVEIIRQDDYVLAVLADGLGSGVKANILATLTSKIAATMLRAGASLSEVVETVASTLPVCQERQIAYSTFSILQVFDDGRGYLVEFDNPPGIYLQKNFPVDLPGKTQQVDGKMVRELHFRMKAGDSIVLFSDGVIHAGVGKLLNMGWQRSEIKSFLAKSVQPGSSAVNTARVLLTAVDCLYQGQPGDDATVLVLKVCPRQAVTVMVGPPADMDRDTWVVEQLLQSKGKRVVCGGTTSQIVSRLTGETLDVTLDFPDPTVPPIGRIKGIDLVTEGIITLSKAYDRMRGYVESNTMDHVLGLLQQDGASLLARLLLEQATEIRFLVGRALNPAHQNPDLSLDLSLKLNVVANIAKILENRGKSVVIDYV